MDTSRITPVVSRAAFGAQKALPSQGQLLHQTLANLFKAIPASGTRDASAKEIGEALQLSPEDMARFMPLVFKATISSAAEGGVVTLVLQEEFRFRPHPEGRDLIIKQVLRGSVTQGKLEVSEGLAAVVATFVNTNIKRIEDATESGKPGVRVVAGLGTEFFPL